MGPDLRDRGQHLPHARSQAGHRLDDVYIQEIVSTIAHRL